MIIDMISGVLIARICDNKKEAEFSASQDKNQIINLVTGKCSKQSGNTRSTGCLISTSEH